jgi:ribA/ribD-fused uncharacterized protein
LSKEMKTPNIINTFIGHYRFLSNFYMAPLEIGGVEYPSSEHAYQAAKTKDKKLRKKIAQQPTAWQAKEMGSKLELRKGWDKNKVEIMRRILYVKFTQHEDLKKKLLATGDTTLVEGNTWGDCFWGVCRGKGENHLGKLLMELREKLKTTT